MSSNNEDYEEEESTSENDKLLGNRSINTTFADLTTATTTIATKKSDTKEAATSATTTTTTTTSSSSSSSSSSSLTKTESSSKEADKLAVSAQLSPCGRLFNNSVFLLFFLTLLSIMSYFDRGAFVGVLSKIQVELDITDSQAGLIGGSFVLGYALVSPICAQVSRRIPSGILLMFGMLVWVLSTGLITFTKENWQLIILRCLTGVGEAAFICLSPALIDDVAPESQKAKWLAIYFSSLPIGYSLGYLGAGVILKYLSWRWVFFLEAAFTLPLALFCYFLPNVKGTNDTKSDSAPVLLKSLSILSRNKVYVTMTLGYCAQTFCLGALTYWLPKYVEKQYEVELHRADFIIGAATAFCGIFGNVFSSILLDYFVYHRKLEKRIAGVFFSFFFVTIAMPFGFISVFMKEFSLFLFTVITCEFFMLSTVTSVNTVFLNCVEDEMRGHSLAMATLMIHILGDLWSPYVFGKISDVSTQRHALFFICCWMLWTVLFWGLALIYTKRYSISPHEKKSGQKI